MDVAGARHAMCETAFSGHLDQHTRKSVTAKGTTMRTWYRGENKKNITFKPKKLTFLNGSHVRGTDTLKQDMTVGISGCGVW